MSRVVSSFDYSPEALAWARGHIEAVIEKYEKFEKESGQQGDVELARRWHTVVFALRREFMGGKGCVIARFDERKPKLERIIDNAQHGEPSG